MFPIRDECLKIGLIAEYWAREIKPQVKPQELRQRLWVALWAGEMDMVLSNGQKAQISFLKLLFKQPENTSFYLSGETLSPKVSVHPDGSCEIDSWKHIPIPSKQPNLWTEKNCSPAFNALAKTNLSDFDSLRPGFLAIPLGRDVFFQWLDREGYKKPTFWATQQREKREKKPMGPKSYKIEQCNALQSLRDEGIVVPPKTAHGHVLKKLNKDEKDKGWSYQAFWRNTRGMYS